MKPSMSLHTIAKNAQIVALLFAAVLAAAGHASAEPTRSHKTKGHFTISAATEVGGTVLPPGDYEVREINSAGQPVLEFVHLFRNELASELVQAEEEEVVAQVKFTKQPLNAPPKRTQLALASNAADATGLEIRGSAVAYEFAPSQMAAGVMPTVDCVNRGSNEALALPSKRGN
jgi:hypothetical protein